MSWSTQSNAALRSSRPSRITCWWSMVEYMSDSDIVSRMKLLFKTLTTSSASVKCECVRQTAAAKACYVQRLACKKLIRIVQRQWTALSNQFVHIHCYFLWCSVSVNCNQRMAMYVTGKEYITGLGLHRIPHPSPDLAAGYEAGFMKIQAQ